MQNFDYIATKEFRESLEADYREMHSCQTAEAWKSVHVLAGSIVESLLIDYLASTPNKTRSGIDPLKLDLAQAVDLCHEERVVSDRTADLCSVVRSYRNLIHPGRMVRLAERPPDKGSAAVAVALVDMIADELAKVRRAQVGFTAEQLLSKLVRDANVMTILKHLLQEVSEPERERLLVDLIPTTHENILTYEGPADEEVVNTAILETAYRVILESVEDDVRKRVAAEFVRILREEDGGHVLRYGKAFFRPADLKFVPEKHQAMVRDHLLGQVPRLHTKETLEAINGMAAFLTLADVNGWLDPFVATITSSAVQPKIKDRARTILYGDVGITASTKVDSAIRERLDQWIDFLKDDEPGRAETVRELKKDIDGIMLPF